MSLQINHEPILQSGMLLFLYDIVYGNGQQELAIRGSWRMWVRRRWRILEALLQEILNLPMSCECLGVIGKTTTRLVSRPNHEA